MKRHVLDVNSLVELVHNDHGLITGFSLRSFKKELAVMDHHSNHYYIIYLLEGSIDLSCSLYSKKLVKESEMAFIPKESAYSIQSHTRRSKALFFAFDTTLIKMDSALFNYFVKNASKKPYEFNTLPINEQMRKVLDMILSQITHTKKVKNSQVCISWNMTIFVTFTSFYKRSELLEFFRPIMSTTMDFRSFVENNFLEAEGNVSKLRKLSGLSRHVFEKNFKDIFGSAPKEWFHEQLRKRITSLAKKQDIRPKELARELHINIQRLAQITRLHFDCTPSELIERVQNGKRLHSQ